MARSESTFGTATPAAEVSITIDLVRALLEPHGINSARAITLLDTGWDNALYTVAAESNQQNPIRPLDQKLVVRLPRRQLAVPLLQHEQRWLPDLLPDTPIAIPRPLLIGAPNADYPWPFTILPYLSGDSADLAPPDDDQAVVLAEFLSKLHRPAPTTAPKNPARGVPIANRRDSFEERWERSSPADTSERQRFEDLWQQALAAPIEEPATWVHGDLHARNILVQNGKFSGVIDWGDICSGDRATDLAAFWMVLHNSSARAQAIAYYERHSSHVTPANWVRARGWALMFGLILIDTGKVDHPRHLAMGERTYHNLLQDAQPAD